LNKSLKINEKENGLTDIVLFNETDVKNVLKNRFFLRNHLRSFKKYYILN